ncbi:Tetrapyrrole biosynthesis uroporphyrinogen III synthase [Penicillium cf. griseofulvum]|uniref:Tetrapyrrole biosynthesis uroporphyrinogen III synthase n=1 Tax=Penicillium cf. griseofulvum TaxID=2972120 RepID=A0A9W9MRY9_9EURO|nr:Tetrapyrrole biosynthesis uroporphyrinogen III synthase [Penicillium cf. griseofulvum]KAJ5448675.1 Tetrapyrrole biosynthesis uroporphyrinogen III synthase [Penicillium cf. griseofulvum]
MPATPILLLKTKSSPQDGYEDFFSAKNYTPTFIPVLEHRFLKKNLTQVRDLFSKNAFTNPRKYGGLIFTSQRAVEGFAQMIEDEKDVTFNIQTTPPLILYTVGPATARTLTTLRDKHLPSAIIHGADTGTGENLAHLILQHYDSLYPKNKPSLLFLVGEVRRDIIPKTLMDERLAVEKRVGVEELVVYETGVMGSFEGDFENVVGGLEGDVWVVVFSPTGCEAMLRVLGLGPFAGTGTGTGTGKRVFVATIGPTTRDHLREKFGFEAHVCAPKPSPEGVLEGIEAFMRGI